MNRNHTRGHVADHHRNKKWAHPPGTLLVDFRTGIFKDRKPPQTASGNHTDSMGIGIINHQSGVFDGHPGGCHGICNKKLGALGFFFRQKIFGMKTLDLGCDFGLIVRHIKPGNLPDT